MAYKLSNIWFLFIPLQMRGMRSYGASDCSWLFVGCLGRVRRGPGIDNLWESVVRYRFICWVELLWLTQGSWVLCKPQLGKIRGPSPTTEMNKLGGKKKQNWGHSVNEEQKQGGDEVTLAQRGKASHLQRDLEWDRHPEHRLNRCSHGQMPPRVPRKTNVATET